MRGPELRNFVGSILLSGLYTGCQIISPDARVTSTPLPSPSPEPRPTLVPPTPTLTRGERYDQFSEKLKNPDMPLYYSSLIGSDVFETREAFNAGNRGRELPSSVAFTWGDGQGTQIAYDGAFLNSAVVFLGREATGRNNFCAPVSDEKRVIYRGLVDEFQPEGEVDKRLVEALMAGMTPDCEYFIDLDTRTAPRNVQEVRQRG